MTNRLGLRGARDKKTSCSPSLDDISNPPTVEALISAGWQLDLVVQIPRELYQPQREEHTLSTESESAAPSSWLATAGRPPLSLICFDVACAGPYPTQLWLPTAATEMYATHPEDSNPRASVSEAACSSAT